MSDWLSAEACFLNHLSYPAQRILYSFFPVHFHVSIYQDYIKVNRGFGFMGNKRWRGGGGCNISTPLSVSVKPSLTARNWNLKNCNEGLGCFFYFPFENPTRKKKSLTQHISSHLIRLCSINYMTYWTLIFWLNVKATLRLSTTAVPSHQPWRGYWLCLHTNSSMGTLLEQRRLFFCRVCVLKYDGFKPYITFFNPFQVFMN